MDVASSLADDNFDPCYPDLDFNGPMYLLSFYRYAQMYDMSESARKKLAKMAKDEATYGPELALLFKKVWLYKRVLECDAARNGHSLDKLRREAKRKRPAGHLRKVLAAFDAATALPVVSSAAPPASDNRKLPLADVQAPVALNQAATFPETPAPIPSEAQIEVVPTPVQSVATAVHSIVQSSIVNGDGRDAGVGEGQRRQVAVKVEIHTEAPEVFEPPVQRPTEIPATRTVGEAAEKTISTTLKETTVRTIKREVIPTLGDGEGRAAGVQSLLAATGDRIGSQPSSTIDGRGRLNEVREVRVGEEQIRQISVKMETPVRPVGPTLPPVELPATIPMMAADDEERQCEMRLNDSISARTRAERGEARVKDEEEEERRRREVALERRGLAQDQAQEDVTNDDDDIVILPTPAKECIVLDSDSEDEMPPVDQASTSTAAEMSDPALAVGPAAAADLSSAPALTDYVAKIIISDVSQEIAKLNAVKLHAANNFLMVGTFVDEIPAFDSDCPPTLAGILSHVLRVESEATTMLRELESNKVAANEFAVISTKSVLVEISRIQKTIVSRHNAEVKRERSESPRDRRSRGERRPRNESGDRIRRFDRRPQHGSSHSRHSREGHGARVEKRRRFEVSPDHTIKRHRQRSQDPGDERRRKRDRTYSGDDQPSTSRGRRRNSEERQRRDEWCAFCARNTSHDTAKCDIFASFSVRMDRLKQMKTCFHCLGPFDPKICSRPAHKKLCHLCGKHSTHPALCKFSLPHSLRG